MTMSLDWVLTVLIPHCFYLPLEKKFLIIQVTPVCWIGSGSFSGQVPILNSLSEQPPGGEPHGGAAELWVVADNGELWVVLAVGGQG